MDLQQAIANHSGSFHCEALSDAAITRSIGFSHRITPAHNTADIPDLPGLRAFYSQFGSVLFYADADSDEAAILLASPSDWTHLRRHFEGWTEAMGPDEREEYLPEWVDAALVIGEEPGTGNYLLMPTTGEQAGHLYLFDHDGFDLIEQAPDIISYAWKQLDLDDSALLVIATHLRFISDATPHQWWIRELRDNRGNVARTYE